MERRIIRPKWQVTIPREIRRALNLFVGQTINWQLLEESAEGPGAGFVFTGSWAQQSEMAAFKEPLARIKQRQKRRKRERLIGISDALMSERGRDKLRSIVYEMMLDLVPELQEVKKGNPGDSDGLH